MGHRQIHSPLNFFLLRITIRPVITLQMFLLCTALICLSRRSIWPVPPRLCQVLRRTSVSHSAVSDCSNRATEAERRRGGQEPVYQSETKACFMITGRGWNSSELTSPPERLHNTRLPFQQIHQPRLPRSSRSLSSAQKYLTCYSPHAPPLIVNPSSHRNGMHFRCCDSGIIFCSLSTSLFTHWSYEQWGPEVLSQACYTLFMYKLCVLYASAV